MGKRNRLVHLQVFLQNKKKKKSWHENLIARMDHNDCLSAKLLQLFFQPTLLFDAVFPVLSTVWLPRAAPMKFVHHS